MQGGTYLVGAVAAKGAPTKSPLGGPYYIPFTISVRVGGAVQTFTFTMPVGEAASGLIQVGDLVTVTLSHATPVELATYQQSGAAPGTIQ
jgi:hypothetical protein